MPNIVCITGATAGIGKATAEIFAKNGYDVIATGRRMQRLEDLKTELEGKYNVQVYPLAFDVMQKDEVNQAIESLPENWKQIQVLVNNAGLALGKESFAKADITDWETMLHTNVDGLLYVSRAVLPFLQNCPGSQVVNLGSIAGKEVYENGNVYCASKFAVDAITKAMRIDLMPLGIKVTGIHPGAVETEFSIVRFKGDNSKAEAAYRGFTPLTPADVADAIWYCCNQPPHVCINDLTLTCLQQAGTYYFNKSKDL